MFFRVVKGSFVRQQRRKTVAVLAVALGTAVTLALFAVNLNVGDKINRELKAFGANINVTPKDDGIPLMMDGVDLRNPRAGRFLDDRDLSALHKFFWRNNILSYAPFLPVAALLTTRTEHSDGMVVGTWFERTPHQAPHREGLKALAPAWRVNGDWPRDDVPDAALMGTTLAQRMRVKIGDEVSARMGDRDAQFRVVGILTSGGAEDEQVLAPIEAVQQLIGRPHAVKRILLSALTTPESQIFEKYHRNPASMPAAEYERWSCTPYASAIARQVQDAIPHSSASVVRQVAATEGAILDKMRTLIIAITLMALLASVLSVASSLSTSVLERKEEIGLMKALGCQSETAVMFFLTEAIGIGLLGGAFGLVGGFALAQAVSRLVLDTSISFNAVLIPVALGVAMLIAVLGSLASLQSILRLNTIEALAS